MLATSNEPRRETVHPCLGRGLTAGRGKNPAASSAPDSFFRANRPSLVISSGILFGPHREARSLSALRILHAVSRIDRDVLRLLCPLEQAAHRIKKVAGLCGRSGAAVT